MAPHIVRVGTQRLQEVFEEQGLREPREHHIRVVEVCVRAPGPDAPNDLDIGSTSVMLSYRREETAEQVAEAHVYRFADGSPRGTPDPKNVKVGNTIFILDRALD